MTSYHVVDKAEEITVSFESGQQFAATVSAHSRSADLAVLAIEGLPPATVSIAKPRSLSLGDEIFTVGYPVGFMLGDEPKFTEGSVSALSGLRGDATYFQMSIPVQPGNSGGPVANMRGEIVGIVASSASIESFYAMTGALPQSVNWATKSENLAVLLEIQDSETTVRDRAGAIAAVSAAVCRVQAR